VHDGDDIFTVLKKKYKPLEETMYLIMPPGATKYM